MKKGWYWFKPHDSEEAIMVFIRGDDDIMIRLDATGSRLVQRFMYISLSKGTFSKVLSPPQNLFQTAKDANCPSCSQELPKKESPRCMLCTKLIDMEDQMEAYPCDPMIHVMGGGIAHTSCYEMDRADFADARSKFLGALRRIGEKKLGSALPRILKQGY